MSALVKTIMVGEPEKHRFGATVKYRYKSCTFSCSLEEWETVHELNNKIINLPLDEDTKKDLMRRVGNLASFKYSEGYDDGQQDAAAYSL